MNESNSWQEKAIGESGVKVPEWELEPTGAEQKENTEASVESEPSVAEKRLEELAAEVKEVAPENLEQKSAQVETMRAVIAEMTKHEQKPVSQVKVKTNNNLHGTPNEDAKWFEAKDLSKKILTLTGAGVGFSVASYAALTTLGLSPAGVAVATGGFLAGGTLVWVGVIGYAAVKVFNKIKKDYGKQLEKEKISEVEKLIPEIALTEEHDALSKFTGKADQIASALLFVSALSVEAVVPQEATAQGWERRQIEQSQSHQKNNTNEMNLTESSKWVHKAIADARADIKQLKTVDDANWFMQYHADTIYNEYYTPTQGKNLRSGSYGIPVVDYTEDDKKILLQGAFEMKKIIEEVNNRFDVEAYHSYVSRLDNIISRIKESSSYSSQTQDKIFKKAWEHYQNGNYRN